MRILHSAITSPIYELAKTFELDIQLGEDSYTLRIELFRNTEKERHFRCHAWQLELFRLTPTFPMDENNSPAHICDGYRQLNEPSVPPTRPCDILRRCTPLLLSIAAIVSLPKS